MPAAKTLQDVARQSVAKPQQDRWAYVVLVPNLEPFADLRPSIPQTLPATIATERGFFAVGQVS